MAWQGATVAAGTAPVPVCSPGQRGAMLSNSGTVSVFLGGPTVSAGQGAALAPGASIWVVGNPLVGDAAADEMIHAVAAVACNVGYLMPV